MSDYTRLYQARNRCECGNIHCTGHFPIQRYPLPSLNTRVGSRNTLKIVKAYVCGTEEDCKVMTEYIKAGGGTIVDLSSAELIIISHRLAPFDKDRIISSLHRHYHHLIIAFDWVLDSILARVLVSRKSYWVVPRGSDKEDHDKQEEDIEWESRLTIHSSQTTATSYIGPLTCPTTEDQGSVRKSEKVSSSASQTVHRNLYPPRHPASHYSYLYSQASSSSSAIAPSHPHQLQRSPLDPQQQTYQSYKHSESQGPQQRPPVAPRSLSMFAGLSFWVQGRERTRREAERCIRYHGGRVVDRLEQAHRVIIPAPEDEPSYIHIENAVRRAHQVDSTTNRTCKVLAAAWLHWSHTLGELLPIEDYIIPIQEPFSKEFENYHESHRDGWRTSWVTPHFDTQRSLTHDTSLQGIDQLENKQSPRIEIEDRLRANERCEPSVLNRDHLPLRVTLPLPSEPSASYLPTPSESPTKSEFTLPIPTFQTVKEIANPLSIDNHSQAITFLTAQDSSPVHHPDNTETVTQKDNIVGNDDDDYEYFSIFDSDYGNEVSEDEIIYLGKKTAAISRPPPQIVKDITKSEDDPKTPVDASSVWLKKKRALPDPDSDSDEEWQPAIKMQVGFGQKDKKVNRTTSASSSSSTSHLEGPLSPASRRREKKRLSQAKRRNMSEIWPQDKERFDEMITTLRAQAEAPGGFKAKGGLCRFLADTSLLYLYRKYTDLVKQQIPLSNPGRPKRRTM